MRQSDPIAAVIAKERYLAERSDYDFAIKQVFGMALRSSLCVGDGISNYFDEKNFFGITVRIHNTYIAVTEDGNTSTVRAYSPNGAGEGTYEQIDLTFHSPSDYSFTVVSGGTMLARGDAQKRFTMVSESDVVYSPDGQTFYSTDDAIAVAACRTAIGAEAFAIDETAIAALENDVRYTLTAAQSQALTEKYFKDIQSTSGPILKDTQFEDIGGKQVATGFIERDGNTTVTLPSDVRYLRSQFRVDAFAGGVTSLVIPASVQAFIDDEGNEITDFNRVGITLLDYTTDIEQAFDSITVAQGSPLFQAGTGNLTVKNGNYIVVPVDRPLPTFDIHSIAAAMRYEELTGVKLRKFYKLSADDVTVDSVAFFTAIEKYDVSWERLQKAVGKVLNYAAPSVLRYKITPNAASVRLSVNLKKDLTMYIGSNSTVASGDAAYAGLCFCNVSGENRTIDVRVDATAVAATVEVQPVQPEWDKESGLPQPEYVSDPTVQTTVHIPMEEDLYRFYYTNLIEGTLSRLQLDTVNAHLAFEQSTQGDKFRYLNVFSRYGDERAVAHLTNDIPNGATVKVPAKFYEHDIVAFGFGEAAVKNKTLTVELSADTEYIEMGTGGGNDGDVVFNNPNFKIVYAGTLDELKAMFSACYEQNSYRTYDMQFTVKCSDCEDTTLKVGWAYNPENPDNEESYKWRATVAFNGQTYIYKVKDGDGGCRLNFDEANTAYYLVGQNGEKATLYYDMGAEWNFVGFPSDRDSRFTMYELPMGQDSFTCTQDGYSLQIDYIVRTESFESVQYYVIEISDITGTVDGKTVTACMPEPIDVQENEYVATRAEIDVGEEGIDKFTCSLTVDVFQQTVTVQKKPE